MSAQRTRMIGHGFGLAGALAILALAAIAPGGNDHPDRDRDSHSASASAGAARGGAALAGAGAPVTDAGPLQRAVEAVMGLRASTLVRLDVDPTRVAKQTAIELDDALVVLDLEPNSVRAEGFRVYASDADGVLTEIEPAPERTFRGVVSGDPGSVVGASIDGDGISAQIILGDDRGFWVEPVAPQLRALLGGPLDEATARAVGGLHVVYRAGDVPDSGQTCGTPARNLAAATAREIGDRVGGGGGTSDGDAPGAITAEIAFDLDSFYVDLFGEAGAQSRVEDIVNGGLNIQYPRDVGITYEITAFVLRLERVYFEDTIFDLLDAFQARWLAEHTDIVRDVAELFTGLNLSGSVVGVATLGSICSDDAFNVVESFGNFNQRADLSAHELGHNWNASHCDCPEHTMNPSITGRRVFHPTFTIPVIIAFRDSIICARPSNDQCDSPEPVADGAVGFDTNPATTDGGTTACGAIAKDLWYEYTASCTGEATASTCGADFDTRIAAYADGDCGGTPIACDDDGCGDASSMTFPVVEGGKYLIRVGGRNAVGIGTLVVACEAVACPDIDGSGAVDFGDILVILAAWGDVGGPADVDGSGTVDFGDVLVILGAWGPCP